MTALEKQTAVSQTRLDRLISICPKKSRASPKIQKFRAEISTLYRQKTNKRNEAFHFHTKAVTMRMSLGFGVALLLTLAVQPSQSAQGPLTFRIEPNGRFFATPENNGADNGGGDNTDQDNDNDNTNNGGGNGGGDSDGDNMDQDNDTDGDNTDQDGDNTNDSSSNAVRYVFKILQIADLHWGENPNTDKGRKKDKKTASAIKTYLEKEKPDFVVLSGDQISSDFMVDNARDKHREVIQAMQNVVPDVKWCILMGNHEDHPYEMIKNGKIVEEIGAKTSRREILEFDSNLDGSYTLPGELSKYTVPIFLQDGTPAADIYVFDTGGGALEKELSEEQVDWFQDVATFSDNDIARPAVAFQHIPTRKGFEFKDGCVGVDSHEVKKIKNKPGILDAMVDQGHTHFLGVGHNHGNDYCCSSDEKLHLCFGRHSGYGGYDVVKRGARVYELELLVDDDLNREFSWRSWVRLDNEDKEDVYQPKKTYQYLSPPAPTPNPAVVPTQSPLSATTGEFQQFEPTAPPTASPSVSPTATASDNPSQTPSDAPSIAPTTSAPTLAPSEVPTQLRTPSPVLSTASEAFLASSSVATEPKTPLICCCLFLGMVIHLL